MTCLLLRRAALLVLPVLLLTAQPAMAAPARDAPSARSAQSGLTIASAQTRFGRILVDGAGRTLYLFTADRGSRSRCYGACAAAWPVAYAKGTPRAGKGVRSSLLGRTKRRDGRYQVTYKGRPLYYYVSEPPGQVLCQNVDEFGGLWLVVRPDGRAVRGS
jgi:predicted lipoprotein with Yx(FWY)xxD motif